MTISSRLRVSRYIFKWSISSELHLMRGEAAGSDPFYAGADIESTWRMFFYPKGSINSSVGYATISLKLCSELPVEVSAKLICAIRNEVITERDFAARIYHENDGSIIENFGKLTDVSYPLLITCQLNMSENKNELPYIRGVHEFHSVLKDISSMLSEQKNTDLLIITRDQMEFRAHKLVLSARSEVFSAMFQSNMTDNLEEKFNIPDMNGCDVEEMLQYVYTGNLIKWSLSSCMNLFVAGDKYKINGLQFNCSSYLTDNIDWETSAEILVLADKHRDECLKLIALDYIKDNAKEVLKTDGWKMVVQEQQHLVDELILLMADN